MYTHIHTRTHTHTHTHIYIHTYIYTHTHIYIYIYVYSGRGFKSHSGRLSITASKNPSVMNTTCISSFRYNVITCARLRLKANVATDEGKDRNEM